jgi:organic hydroperoxide reductase OsmC/OhrA
MPHREHRYHVEVVWTGNTGAGTADYRSYERSYETRSVGKPSVPGSSDAAFRGDRTRWNPEDLLVSALASCHMLSYLHLCATAGIVVTEYADTPEGVMHEAEGGGGRFSRVTLKPIVKVGSQADIERATALHHNAHEKCFIANSVNFSVDCEPSVRA